MEIKTKIIIGILAMLANISFASSFKVTATVKGLPDGTVLQLLPLSHGKAAPLAEVKVSGEECVFKGSLNVDVPLCVHIQVKDAFGRKTFMIDKNDDIRLSCTFAEKGENKGKVVYSITDFVVCGSPMTEKYNQLKGEIERNRQDFHDFRDLLGKRYPQLTNALKSVKNRAEFDSVRRHYATDYRNYAYIDSISYSKMNISSICEMLRHGDSFWGPLLMLDTWWYFTPRERPVYESFTQEAKDSYYGRMVKEELYAGGKQGEKAKSFSIKDEKGKTHTLESLSKGKKYILLDFWASWCGPCRREIPNVKKQYELYKSKGFEVVSISIDKKKSDWQKALNDEQLEWPNFLDDGSVADLYHVKSIPAMYLLSADGTLIATDMEARGEALAKKLSQLFKE